MAKHVRKPGRLHLSPRLSEQEKRVSPAAERRDPEEDMPTPRYHSVKALLFFAVMAAMAVVVWILPLRSTYSETEKRELAKFPAFSVEALASGDYFSDIGVWFSDTFPAREWLIEMRGKWEGWYGIRDNVIHGSQDVGDDIPDVTLPSNTPSTLPSIDWGTTTQGGTTTTVTGDGTTTTAPPTTTTTVTNGPTTTTTQRPIVTGTLGSLWQVGDAAYEMFGFNQSASDAYAEAMNAAAAKLNGKAYVYSMVIPKGIDIVLDPSKRPTGSTADQRKAINYIYSQLNGAYAIDIYDALLAHNQEYIYFRTDHHWTSLGAYYAYDKFMQMKGATATPLSAYDTSEFEGFYGTFHSQQPGAGLRADTVTAYHPQSSAEMYFEDAYGGRTYWPVIANVNGWASNSLYNTFIGGDNPYTCITNDDRTDGSSIIVVKESFGNAFVPFLVDHYQTVHVVDYRYYTAKGLSELVDQTGSREVLFINNISATSTWGLVDYIHDFATR